MTFLLSGASGFIGSHLCHFLSKNTAGHIQKLKRTDSVDTLLASPPPDIIINLAGSSIAQGRWNQQKKEEIYQSRIQTTKLLVSLIEAMPQKPKLFISASAIGYYGFSDNTIFSEETPPIPDSGFLQKVCQDWEKEALKAKDLGVNTQILRLGVVLSDQGGFLKSVLPAFKYGLGGVLGSGNQGFSWIELSDLCALIFFIIERTNLSGGVINAVAPTPISNRELTYALGKQLHRPTWFHLPSFFIKLIFGEKGEELFLKGQKVCSKKLENEYSSFEFKFKTIESVLKNLNL